MEISTRKIHGPRSSSTMIDPGGAVGKRGRCTLLVLALCLTASLSPSGKIAKAQAGQPLSAGLRVEKKAYNLGDPGEKIKIFIGMANPNREDLIVPRDFPKKDFHLYLDFIDPDGKPVGADCFKSREWAM